MIPSSFALPSILPSQRHQLLVCAFDDLLDPGHPLVEPVDDGHLGDQLGEQSRYDDDESCPGEGTPPFMQIVTEDVIVESCALEADHKHKS